MPVLNHGRQYLQIFLPVEDNRLRLDFAVFDVTFVATQHNWDVFAHTYKISVPIRHILVCDACSYVKHDDSTLTCISHQCIAVNNLASFKIITV